MTAQLNGRDRRTFPDLGSECVTLRKTGAGDMVLTYQGIAELFGIRGHASGRMAPVERTRAQLKVDASTATADVLMVSDDAQAIPPLIGQSFMEQTHVMIIPMENTGRVFEEHLHFQDENGTFENIQILALSPRNVSVLA